MSLITTIQQAIAERRIADSFRHMDALRRTLHRKVPSYPGYGVFLGLFAQLVHLGYGNVAELRRLLDRCTDEAIGPMRVDDYVPLTLGRGISDFLDGKYADGIMALRSVRESTVAKRDPVLMTAATYYLGRCHARQGEDRDALRLLSEARVLAEQAGLPRMAAVAAVPESWLTFHHAGDAVSARTLLVESRQVLQTSDDRVTLAHSLITEARINRRTGKEEDSIPLLERACEHLRRPQPAASSLAKALTDLAIAERLFAVRLHSEIDDGASKSQANAAALTLLGNPRALLGALAASHDQIAASLKKVDVQRFVTTVAGVARQGPSRKDDRRRKNALIEKHRASSGRHLDAAQDLYTRLGNRVGSGLVTLNRGFLALDCADWPLATTSSRQAFEAGQQAGDHSLMTRARILGCQAALEEATQSAPEPPDPAGLRRATDLARAAVREAALTQNIRLQGKALTWLGLAIAADPDGDAHEARRCRDAAEKCFDRSSRDYAAEDFLRLNRSLRDTSDAEEIIRGCLAAAVRGQSRDARRRGERPLLQSLLDRVEEQLVLAAFDQCGRNESRTYVHLGVGFDKVRKVLGRLGLQGRAASS